MVVVVDVVVVDAGDGLLFGEDWNVLKVRCMCFFWEIKVIAEWLINDSVGDGFRFFECVGDFWKFMFGVLDVEVVNAFRSIGERVLESFIKLVIVETFEVFEVGWKIKCVYELFVVVAGLIDAVLNFDL